MTFNYEGWTWEVNYGHIGVSVLATRQLTDAELHLMLEYSQSALTYKPKRQFTVRFYGFFKKSIPFNFQSSVFFLDQNGFASDLRVFGISEGLPISVPSIPADLLEQKVRLVLLECKEKIDNIMPNSPPTSKFNKSNKKAFIAGFCIGKSHG